MSATATSIDFKAFLADTIQHNAETLIKDLKHVPDDKLNVSPMGCARRPLEFVAECAGFNRLLTKTIKGEEAQPPSQEEREKFYASCDNYEKAQHLLEDSTAVLVDAIKSLTEQELTREVTAYWGQPMPLYRLIHAAAVHMAYHDGQVNYIQCLYGDAKVHWMED